MVPARICHTRHLSAKWGLQYDRTYAITRSRYIHTYEINSTHVSCDADTHPHKPRVRVSDDVF